MPAESTAQRQLAGMALRYKRGGLTKPSTQVKRMAKMTASQLGDFARKPKGMRYHKRGD